MDKILHVSCAIRNCKWFEYFVPEEDFQFPMKGLLPIDADGNITVPKAPGVGVELDWDLIQNNCVSYKVLELSNYSELTIHIFLLTRIIANYH